MFPKFCKYNCETYILSKQDFNSNVKKIQVYHPGLYDKNGTSLNIIMSNILIYWNVVQFINEYELLNFFCFKNFDDNDIVVDCFIWNITIYMRYEKQVCHFSFVSVTLHKKRNKKKAVVRKDHLAICQWVLGILFVAIGVEANLLNQLTDKYDKYNRLGENNMYWNRKNSNQKLHYSS